jgi:formylglycine-generating enzyme required for sulfatase activity
MIATLAVGCGRSAQAAEASADVAHLSSTQEAAAQARDVPVQTTNSIGMKMVLIPAGEFMMGSRETEKDLVKAFAVYDASIYPPYFHNEFPYHRVRITKPFYLGSHEVTVGQFRKFVEDAGYKTDAEKGTGHKGVYGFNPYNKRNEYNATYSWRKAVFEQSDEHPVVNVSWNDATEFCKWLSRKEAKTYRLPTEAEWEYACRAGTTTRYFHGDDPEGLAALANVADATATAKFPDWKWTIRNSDGYVFTAPVGRFRSNAFGLFDMHGNVLEWCCNRHASDYYKKSPLDDPIGPESGALHVLRGGSWYYGPGYARSACRRAFAPETRYNYTGFRTARIP